MPLNFNTHGSLKSESKAVKMSCVCESSAALTTNYQNITSQQQEKQHSQPEIYFLITRPDFVSVINACI